MQVQLIQLFIKNSSTAEGGRQQQTIRIEQFIKNVNFDSQLKAGVLPKGVINTLSREYKDWHLQQSFLEQKSTNTNEQIVPMLLIPFFKIKDQQGQYVKYTIFEQCDINNLTTVNGHYYIGEYCLLYSPSIKSIILSVGDEKTVNLKEQTGEHKSGYLILRDTNSEAAMLYYGLILDLDVFNSPECELGTLFKEFVLNDQQYNREAFLEKIGNPEDIVINIEFNPNIVPSPIKFILPNNDPTIEFKEYTLTLNRTPGNRYNIKFIGYLENDELYFRVVRDMEMEEDEKISMTIAKRFFEQAKKGNPNLEKNESYFPVFKNIEVEEGEEIFMKMAEM